MTETLLPNENSRLGWIPPLLILYNFCANLANDIYLPSMPQLTQVFDTSSAVLQLTMVAWFAGVATPQLFFGPLTDRIGRRPVLLGGGLCFLIATLICTTSTHVWLLIVGRFFQGVGVCSLNVTTFGILIDLYNYQSRTRIMNKINLFGTMAPLIGPVIGGYILAYFNWRCNFIIIFLMGVISVLGLWLKLPESNNYLNPHALNIKSLTQNYLSLVQNKSLFKHLIPYCFLLGGLVAYLIASPFIIIDQLKIKPEYFGYAQLPVFGAYVGGSLYLDRHEDEWQIKKLLRLGIACVFGGTLLMLLLSLIFGNHLFVFLLPMVLYALGFSLCSAPLVNEVMSAATATKGSAAAFLGFGMSISCTLTSALVGMVYNNTILSIASLLSGIAMLAFLIYFLPLSQLPVQVESHQ